MFQHRDHDSRYPRRPASAGCPSVFLPAPVPHPACAHHMGSRASIACPRPSPPCWSSPPRPWFRTRSAHAPCPWRWHPPQARAARRAGAFPSAFAEKPVYKHDFRFDPLPKGRVWDVTHPTLDVPHQAASIAAQPTQGLAHPLILPRLGIGTWQVNGGANRAPLWRSHRSASCESTTGDDVVPSRQAAQPWDTRLASPLPS